MGEFMDAVRSKYFKPKNTEVSEKMRLQRVKSTILGLCEANLQSEDDEFTFEVLKGELPYAVEAISDELIRSRYIIVQISESLFLARMVVVDLNL